MTRRLLSTVICLAWLPVSDLPTCAAASLLDNPSSPYQQALAAIGYHVDSNAATGYALSATEIRDIFTAWRESQRPVAGDVYAIVIKKLRGAGC